jgi:hypothetical protein
MQEINKWDELIHQLREGKNVNDILEKSFKRKEELEKELSNSLRLINMDDNAASLNGINGTTKDRQTNPKEINNAKAGAQ